MSDRMKKQAEKAREAAKTVRDRGNEEKAQRMEAYADRLDSGKVVDRTDEVSSLLGRILRSH
ncbi:hypothetical protein QF032_003774 [Streptomyces achromogenes]|uniref:hypothetical protein n=1 Tax=Streptomyces achromogenes TaxID=67255 RepID=UPI002782FE29|nr:hypothetical protein [Streptomyces achromogenes]MDQ0831930.1 hypothetical protein [Streptomyces achromogenes]